jgi:heat shock protein 5
MMHLPYRVVDRADKPCVEMLVQGENGTFAPEEVTATIMLRLKQNAESFLGAAVTNAVLTVPVDFSDAQREATRDAARIAGLTAIRFIREPIAAATAYGLDQGGGEKNILVFDLGDGTLDVTLLSADHGVFEVIATHGDEHLGAEDFDANIVRYMMESFEDKAKTMNKTAVMQLWQRLTFKAEEARKALSVHSECVIEFSDKGENRSWTLSRAKFEELNADFFDAVMSPVFHVLGDAKLASKDVHEVVLVGGGSRMPKVQQLLRDFFGLEPRRGISPDEVVAFGAAVVARYYSRAYSGFAE